MRLHPSSISAQPKCHLRRIGRYSADSILLVNTEIFDQLALVVDDPIDVFFRHDKVVP